MAKQCCFCPTVGNLTLEHLWGAWIGEALRPRRYFFTRQTVGRPNKFGKDGLDLQTRVACGPCNSGWMSDLENKTKDAVVEMLANGTPKILGVRELATLAALIFTKTVVANAMENTPFTPFLSFGERRTFARTLVVPNGVQMWFGRFPGTSKGIWKNSYIETPGSTSRDFKGQIFTFGFGYLFIQAAIVRWKKRASRRTTDQAQLTQSSAWIPACTPFWPTATTVVWPPTHDFPYDGINELVNRWTKINFA